MKLITPFAFFAIVLSSCEHQTQKTVVTDARMNADYELIGYPVKLHYVQRNGMRYMIASGIHADAGTSITNITLDSLQCEYYKNLLKK